MTKAKPIEKPVTDWTPEDFIQHECNLDQHERILTGYIRLGATEHSEEVKGIDRTVKQHRALRRQYFEHHAISPVL
jgi:hypothetical protein